MWYRRDPVAHNRLTFILALPLLATGCTLFGVEPSDAEGETSVGSTSTSDGSTSDGSEAESEDTGTPPPENDLPPDCDVFMQDCPDGEKCVAYSRYGGIWDANKCVPVTGDQAPGEPCTYAGNSEATDDCDATSACWGVNVDMVGTCRAFCTGNGNDPQCPESDACLAGGYVAFCIPTCDPVAQDCEDGLGCFFTNIPFECVPAGELQPGEPCGYINDCAGGLSCTAAEVLPGCDSSSCCTPFCALEMGDAQCGAVPGTSCVPFYREGSAPPDYEHVGVCIVL